MLCHFFELLFFIIPNVAEAALGETKQKEATLTLAKKKDAAKSLGFALARAGNSLLDYAATKIGINLPIFRALGSLYKRSDWNLLLSDEPTKPRIRKNAQDNSPMSRKYITLSVIDDF